MTLSKTPVQTNKTHTAQRQAALVAGVALIVMAIAAGFSVNFVLDSLMVPGDAAATAVNIQSSEALFGAGIVGWLIIFLCDVLVSWGLYVFFKPVNAGVSLLTGWMRLAYTAVLGAAILNLVMVLLLATNPTALTAFTADQSDALLMLFVNGFYGGWSMGLVVFGVHLLGLGYLALKSGFVPKILGILILLAAAGYIIVHGAGWLIPTFDDIEATVEMLFIIPMILGEVGLAVWLIVKGLRRQPIAQPTLETA